VAEIPNNETSFTRVYDWMANKLNLSGNELLVYALIYSFARCGKKEFYGSAEYIAARLNIGLRTVMYSLKKLADKGLIKKRDVGRYRNYTIIPMQNNADFYANLAHHSKDIINKDSKDNNKDTTTTDAKASVDTVFNFQETCKSLGFYISQSRTKTLIKEYISGSENIKDELLSALPEFAEYVSSYIDKKYADKNKDEKLKIFLSLIVSSDKYNDYINNKEVSNFTSDTEMTNENVINEFIKTCYLNNIHMEKQRAKKILDYFPESYENLYGQNSFTEYIAKSLDKKPFKNKFEKAKIFKELILSTEKYKEYVDDSQGKP